MDAIELAFGISPDGGSGSYELQLALAPILSVIWLYRYRIFSR
jgi:hypothetical protein